jgi:hypothetical protein
MLHQEHELHRRRRARNMAVLGLLVGFAAMMFLVTIVRLGGDAVLLGVLR